MIQQTIELAGWQQFISPAEVTAIGVALVIGWAGTEMLKRIAQQVRKQDEPGWVWAWLGFAVTFVAAMATWPKAGVFPHPTAAAMAVALAAPSLYAIVIYALRRTGFQGVASILTGNKRWQVKKPPRGVDRRRK